MNVSTSLDIRSSTVPTRGRRHEGDFRTRQSSPLVVDAAGMDRLTTFW